MRSHRTLLSKATGSRQKANCAGSYASHPLFLQHWFELSDPGADEALYDSRSMRLFMDIDLGSELVPDKTTICNFCHLIEKNKLGGELFRLVNIYLVENGMKLNRGTIVDATFINIS